MCVKKVVVLPFGYLLKHSPVSSLKKLKYKIIFFILKLESDHG